MRLRYTLLLLLIAITAHGQVMNPFKTLKFDKVVMYDFEGQKGNNLLIVDKSGNLANTIKKQAIPDTTEIRVLNTKLGVKQSYGGATASCFDPHLGIIYFLNGKVVAHITICMDCNRLSSSIDIPAQKQGKVGAGDEAYYISDGMSKSFRKFLNGLVKKYKFSHEIPASLL